MVTPEQPTGAERYHVVCDDNAFWQWSGDSVEAEALMQADQLVLTRTPVTRESGFSLAEAYRAPRSAVGPDTQTTPS
jgi:hypothetical protein